MKNQFMFNSSLTHKTECDEVVNVINGIIRSASGLSVRFLSYAQLKAKLKNFEYPVLLDNTYRANEYGNDDFDLQLIEGSTTINIYWGLVVYTYVYKNEAFTYKGQKSINVTIPDEQCNAAEIPEAKVAEVKKPVEPSKPEPEVDMKTRLSKAQDYFAINKIFADNFDKFVDESIGSLTSNLINIRETINSFPSPFINLTAGEIEKYIKPFDNIIALIDIENPDKAAYMIKSAFNALLIAHMDARLNNEDEDLHIEYNVNSK